VCSPHSYIIKKVYLRFVIHIVDLVFGVSFNLLNGFSTG